MMPFQALRYGSDGSGWRVAATFTPNTDSPGWTGYTLRNKIQSPPNLVSGNLGPSSMIMLRLRAANSGTALQIAKFYVGLQAASGNPYDFAATPVQALFSGSASVTIPVGTAVLTDPISLTIPLSQSIVASAYLTAGDLRTCNTADGGNRRFFRTGDDASSVIGTGTYTESSSGQVYMIEEIQVM